MKDKIAYIETSDKKYPICFNLNVMEEIQEKYGTMADWGDIVENEGGEPKIKELKDGLLAMINEAIDIENENKTEKMQLLTHKQVGRIIGEVGLNAVLDKVKSLTIESTKVEETESKNE